MNNACVNAVRASWQTHPHLAPDVQTEGNLAIMQTPRLWQLEAKDALWPRLLDRGGPRTHIIIVVPGGGKTFFAIWIGYLAIKAGIYRRIVFLSPPRRNVQDQWTKEVDRVRELLRSEGFDAQLQTSGFMMVGSQDDADSSTLVFVDEYHHLVEKQTWGENVVRFAGAAADRILLSGTPARDDKKRMPFLSPGDKHVYQYNYGAAVHDKVCRYLEAHDDYDAMMVWQEGSRELKHSFGRMEGDLFEPEELDRPQDSRRFATSINTQYTLAQKMITDAVRKLKDIRITHPRAQGMIVASNVLDAREVAEFMQSYCGVDPTLIYSDSGHSDEDLRNFRKNSGNHKDWLVSVTQVSEGTDIPNLCVLVYKSRIRTGLFMTQVAGRVMRMSVDTPSKAHVYYPKDDKVRKIFWGLNQEAKVALEGEERHSTWQNAATDSASSSDDSGEDGNEARCERDLHSHLTFDDASSDGSIDAEAQAWVSIAANPDDPNDEDEECAQMLATMKRRRPGEDTKVLRAQMRTSMGLPPLVAVDLKLSEEHQKAQLLLKLNQEVCRYVFAFKKLLGGWGKKIGFPVAMEKLRLVLRAHRRNGRKEDARRLPKELAFDELRDIVTISLPSRITKLRRMSGDAGDGCKSPAGKRVRTTPSSSVT